MSQAYVLFTWFWYACEWLETFTPIIEFRHVTPIDKVKKVIHLYILSFSHLEKCRVLGIVICRLCQECGVKPNPSARYFTFRLLLAWVACDWHSSIGLVLGGSFLCVVESLGISRVPRQPVYVLVFAPIEHESPGCWLCCLCCWLWWLLLEPMFRVVSTCRVGACLWRCLFVSPSLASVGSLG